MPQRADADAGLVVAVAPWEFARPLNLALKRVFDLIVASVAVTVLSPLVALIALAIRIDSAGPVFFRQQRMGRNRRLFDCMKFRTMHVDGEQRLHAHLNGHAVSREEWERFRKLKSADPRITRVGRILRRFSIDELPQLINVFRNEMSLVGPRPYMPEEGKLMGDVCDTIVKAVPGITGLWQVSGRNQLTFEQRLHLDQCYVENWSLPMDVKILLKTLVVVLHGRGAY